MAPIGSSDLSAIAPAAVSPQPDRASDSLAGGTPETLRSDLVALLGLDRVLARPIDLIRAVRGPVAVVTLDRVARQARKSRGLEVGELRAIVTIARVVADAARLEPTDHQRLERARCISGEQTRAADISRDH